MGMVDVDAKLPMDPVPPYRAGLGGGAGMSKFSQLRLEGAMLRPKVMWRGDDAAVGGDDDVKEACFFNIGLVLLSANSALPSETVESESHI